MKSKQLKLGIVAIALIGMMVMTTNITDARPKFDKPTDPNPPGGHGKNKDPYANCDYFGIIQLNDGLWYDMYECKAAFFYELLDPQP